MTRTVKGMLTCASFVKSPRARARARKVEVICLYGDATDDPWRDEVNEKSRWKSDAISGYFYNSEDNWIRGLLIN